MRSYCYCTRDANNGQKLTCGTIHADSMDDAARRIVRRDKLTAVAVTLGHGAYEWTTHHYEHNGREVNLYVGAHPENL